MSLWGKKLKKKERKKAVNVLNKHSWRKNPNPPAQRIVCDTLDSKILKYVPEATSELGCAEPRGLAAITYFPILHRDVGWSAGNLDEVCCWHVNKLMMYSVYKQEKLMFQQWWAWLVFNDDEASTLMVCVELFKPNLQWACLHGNMMLLLVYSLPMKGNFCPSVMVAMRQLLFYKSNWCNAFKRNTLMLFFLDLLLF